MGTIFILLFVFVIETAAQSHLKSQIAYRPVSKSFSLEDSTNINFRTGHTGVNIGFQVIVGQGMGFVSGFVPFAIAWGSAFSRNSSRTTTDVALLLVIPSYIIGTATGVHWVAHLENKNHSFWKNVGFTAIGGGVSVITGLTLASTHHRIPAAGVWVMLLSPLAESLVYTCFLADWPEKPAEVNNFESRNLEVNSYLAKDIFERSQIVNLELFRIKL
jgi:hypothetical protein